MNHHTPAESLSPAALNALQARLFREAMKRSFSSIPLYRERLMATFGTLSPDTMSDEAVLKTLERLPAAYREDFNAISHDALSNLDRRLFFIDSTSGSTGSPKSRFCSIEDDLLDTALLSRAFASYGLGPADRILTFDLADLTYYTQFTKAMQDLGIKNSIFVSARADFRGSMENALRFAPTAIITMPSIFNRCREVFFDHCKKSSGIGKFIYFGEPLEEDLRRHLHEAYAIESFSLYGSTDIGWIAAECEAHDGMHLFADSVILHLLADTGSAGSSAPDEGLALFTSLRQTGKPSLRYANGDRLRIDNAPCSCGRTTPRIHVARRETDIFTLLGMKISIREIQEVIYRHEAISCYFQVELIEKIGKIHFIIRLPHHLRSSAEQITRGLENRVGLAFYTCIDIVVIDLVFVGDDYFATRKIPRLVDRRGEAQ